MIRQRRNYTAMIKCKPVMKIMIIIVAAVVAMKRKLEILKARKALTKTRRRVVIILRP